jgi:probable phosphoglycerate mutase
MQTVLDRIVSENKGKTIAVVSHGCAIRNYLCYAAGNTIDKIHDVGWSDNTSVSLVEFDELKPRLVFKNNSDHLTGELSTLAFSNWCKSENGVYSEISTNQEEKE